MKILKIICLTACVSFFTPSCKDNTNTTKPSTMNVFKKDKSYDWSPTESAPENYPIAVHSGTFFLNNSHVASIPDGGRTVQNGWGKQGSMWVVGDDVKPIPDRLNLTWLSYTENTFYTGDFDLPREKIVNLFEEGFLNRMNQHTTYTGIVCGMAPGGVVSIWLIGAGKTTEVAHFQAKETEVAMKDFAPGAVISRNDYVNNRLEGLDDTKKQYLQREGITFGKWTAYRKRYAWKPVLIKDQEQNFHEVFIDYVNGEHLFTTGKNAILKDYHPLALPKYAKLYWKDKDNNLYGSKLWFDEAEITQAFSSLNGTATSKNLDLIVTVDKYNGGMTIVLKNDSDSIPIEKTKVKIFETKDYLKKSE